MKRVIGFLIVLALCWALVPAAVAHAQDEVDESDGPPDVSDDCVVGIEDLWDYYTAGELPDGCTTVRIDLPETYYPIAGDGGPVTLADGTTVTPDADGRVTLPDGTMGTLVAPIRPTGLIIEEVADGTTSTRGAPIRPTRLIIDGVPYSP